MLTPSDVNTADNTKVEHSLSAGASSYNHPNTRIVWPYSAAISQKIVAVSLNRFPPTPLLNPHTRAPTKVNRFFFSLFPLFASL